MLPGMTVPPPLITPGVMDALATAVATVSAFGCEFGAARSRTRKPPQCEVGAALGEGEAGRLD